MSGGVRFVHVGAEGLAPYRAGLVELERGIRYPIADGGDHFTIDHGAAYAPFFAGLGEPHFLLALDGDRVVGTLAQMRRVVHVGGRPVEALYLGDYKIAASHRGGRVARRMLVAGLAHLTGDRSLRRARLWYLAAMRGDRGDVLTSARGAHLGKIARPLARLVLYFAPPEKLAALPDAPGLVAPPPAVDLSPGHSKGAGAGDGGADGMVSTAGRKDLRLASTGRPWPLVHLVVHPAAARPTWPAYLRRCGQALRADPSVRCCFALDERLGDHIAWLDGHGVEPGATCTVHAVRFTLCRPPPGWLNLATCEI